MLLAELVAACDAVAATRSRNAKIAALADVLKRLEPEEIQAAAGLLCGQPRQGRIGVGWALLSRLEAPPSDRASLTVCDVDAALSAICDATGQGSARARSDIVVAMLARATAAEGEFVRRVLTGGVRQGALEGIVVEAVARASGVSGELVRRALMLGGDLGRTTRVALLEGARGLAAIGLRVMHGVQPMLAATAEGVADALATMSVASVEWKLDGVRIQVHRDGEDVRVFTRNLNDVTSRMPEVVEMALSLPVRSVVLDGEAIGLDVTSRPHAFQDTMSRVGRYDGGGVGLVPFVFDVLHLDGEDLIDRPLAERLSVLERVASGRRVPAVSTSSAEEAAAFLEDAIGAGHEGVMIKDLSSAYAAGRRGKAWRKVKPVRTFDLVVLGAEWGHGRRRGWLSNLHLGARDPSGGFVMVGKTFKGLTDEVLAWQTGRLLELETARRGIAVFVRPELVVEVALDGAQASERYPGGVALRFARVKRYRPDKRAGEADTIEDVRACFSGKLADPNRRGRNVQVDRLRDG